MAARKRATASETWSFLRKTGYILAGAACGLLAMYWYVTEYGGEMPPRGTGSDIVKESWHTFKPILIPIIVAFGTSFIHRFQRKRESDRK